MGNRHLLTRSFPIPCPKPLGVWVCNFISMQFFFPFSLRSHKPFHSPCSFLSCSGRYQPACGLIIALYSKLLVSHTHTHHTHLVTHYTFEGSSLTRSPPHTVCTVCGAPFFALPFAAMTFAFAAFCFVCCVSVHNQPPSRPRVFVLQPLRVAREENLALTQGGLLLSRQGLVVMKMIRQGLEHENDVVAVRVGLLQLLQSSCSGKEANVRGGKQLFFTLCKCAFKVKLKPIASRRTPFLSLLMMI